MASVERSSFAIPIRIHIALGIVAALFFILILRLWYLQIVKGEFYRQRSENNRIRTVYVPPPRGLIFDRYGDPLVRNRPAFNIEFITEDAPQPDEVLEELSKIVGVDHQLLKARTAGSKKRRRFEPKILMKDVNRDVVAKVAAQRYNLPGVVINVEPTREYLYGDSAAHVLGYIREITNKQLESPEFSGYRYGDVVGQYGVEAKLERLLQGQRGVQYVIVDAKGNRIGESLFQREQPGNNVTLTIDLGVQRAADDALKDKKGAIVAMDPNSGEILALSSAPRFDPNVFASEVSSATWNEIVSGPEKRMSDRALQGAFPPGSVFKIFMSIAAISEGVVGLNEHFNCPGYLHFGGRNFKCHKKEGHGLVDHYDALVQSCDVFYYSVGNRLGVDRIHQYATLFGFGERTGVDLFDEKPGLIPSTAWKKSAFKKPEMQKWYPGETLSVAIGQGAVTTTPIQIVRGVSAVVNGGKLLTPYVIKRVESHDGRLLDQFEQSTHSRKLDVSDKILEIVKKDMVGVVNDPRGTGKRSKVREDLNITVGGKTGTAQVVSLEMTGKHHAFNDHAWFVGYAPAEKPEIVVVALVENGGHGGATSAPLVKSVFEAFFDSRRPGVRPGTVKNELNVNRPTAD